MFNRLQSFLARFVGPNAAHVLDGLIAFELTAGTTALASPSARTYGFHHPAVAAAIAVGTPLATAFASKFRKAAHAKTPPDAATSVTAATVPAPAPAPVVVPTPVE